MKYKKIILDVLTTIIMILLMNNNFTGVKRHEVLGIAIVLLFVIHKYFNWSWIKNITLNLFNKKTPTKTKIMYFLDILLLMLLLLNTLSGILISQNLFTYLNARNIKIWSNLHHLFAYGFLVVIGIHLGLHWQYVMNIFKKIFKIKKTNNIIKTILRITFLGIVIFGIISLLNPEINKKFIPEKLLNKITNITTEKEVINSIKIEKNETLEDYLGKSYCNGCSRKGPLTTPECIVGEELREEKIEEYNLNNQEVVIEEIGIEKKSITKTTIENKEPNVFNYISIMGLFAGGTYYISKTPKKKLKTNKH